MVLRWMGATAVVAAIVLAVAAAQAAEGNAGRVTPGLPANGAESMQPRLYTHPQRGYQLIIPPRADVVGQGRGDISIRSLEGYVLNIQTGDSSPGVPLAEMVGRLEAQYLGDGRPWHVKLAEDEMRVSGMPARAAVYEGAGSRARVVIARGARTDFVFMFFAPVRSFEEQSADFRSILASFRPAPEDQPPARKPGSMMPAESGRTLAMPGTIPREPTAGPEPSSGAEAAPSPEAAPVAPVEESVVRTDATDFSDPSLGYSVSYPVDWEVVRPSAYAVVFGGRENTPAYPLSVSIQNVNPPQAATRAEAVESVYLSLKNQLKGERWAAAYFGEGPFLYRKNGANLAGQQFLVNYSEGEVRYKQLTIVLPRSDVPVVYIWSYRAPQEQFHTYWPIVENMLRSWTILGTGR